MPGEDLLARSAANCASAMRQWAARAGHRTAATNDVSAVDMEMGRGSPMSSACLLAPATSGGQFAEVVEWAEQFFSQGRGGPIQIWSAWPTPDIAGRGYRRFETPSLVRPPGGSAAPVPPELSVARARSAVDLVAAGRLADEVFRAGAPEPDALFPESILDDDLEVFVGHVDGEVVATSVAHVAAGLCGVYAVATAEHARGRGYGEALTWAATLFRPDLPAALQASPSGLPIYLRMGFAPVGTFTVWHGPRPGAPPSDPARPEGGPTTPA